MGLRERGAEGGIWEGIVTGEYSWQVLGWFSEEACEGFRVCRIKNKFALPRCEGKKER